MSENLIKRTYREKYSCVQDEKINIIREAIESKCFGIDFIDGKIYIRRTCTYNGYGIGDWVMQARSQFKQGINTKYTDKLIAMGLYLGTQKETMPVEEKLKLLKQAIEEKAKGITIDQDGYVNVTIDFTYHGYNLGNAIKSLRRYATPNPEFVQGLKALKLAPKYFITDKDVIDTIRDAINRSIDGVTVNSSNKYEFDIHLEHNNIPIGKIIDKVRRGTKGDVHFRKKLDKLNIELRKPLKKLNENDKIEIVSTAIKEKNPDIKIMRDGVVVIFDECVYQDYPIGKWIRDALGSNGYSKIDFLKKLSEINVNLDTKITSIIKQVSKLEQLINENSGEIKFRRLPSGKIFIYTTLDGKYSRTKVDDENYSKMGTFVNQVINGQYDMHPYVIPMLNDLNIITSKRDRYMAKRIFDLMDFMQEEMQDLDNSKYIKATPDGKYHIYSKTTKDKHRFVTLVNKGNIVEPDLIKELHLLNIDLSDEAMQNMAKKDYEI